MSSQPDAHRTGSVVFWFTGLPASGKSTLARHLLGYLINQHSADCHLYDADVEREQGVLLGLGWSAHDRIATVKALANAASNHRIALVTLVTPTAEEQQLAAQILGKGFHLIHVTAPADLAGSEMQQDLCARTRVPRPQRHRNCSIRSPCHRPSP